MELVLQPQLSSHGDAHQLTNLEQMRRFVLAGNATFTVVSKKTGTRFTFKAARPDESKDRRPVWFRLLNGPNNESDFVFLGTLWQLEDGELGMYIHNRRPGAVSDGALSVKALRWTIEALKGYTDEGKFFASTEVWHEGRCGRCGRKLTVPESIESGFGPECINYV